ncbi:DgyrCDS6952 [Dimorphilus gyrociliatus]|uniref:DgyrCDS6952 n=1 Tax=Dimorphilus gyrociliatus TaxID=2664684 RepID=A0A7I8VR80_9ANNE|nr:DgyrCDS6952 [Dimorphilus gyrociliatus]
MGNCMTPKENISAAEKLVFYVNIYVDGIISVAGIFGNILILLTLKNTPHVSSYTIYIRVLAFVEVIFVAYCLLYTTFRTAAKYTDCMANYLKAEPILVSVALPIAWMLQTSSIWITAMLAVDRRIAVDKPLKSLTFCTSIIAKRVSALTILGCVLFNTPRFAYYSAVSKLETNASYVHIAHLRVNLPGWDASIYYWLYHVGLTFALVFILPLGIIAVCDVYLVKALRKADKFRQLHARESKNKVLKTPVPVSRTIVVNMVVVISKLLICQTPDFLMGIAQAARVDRNAAAYKIFSTLKEMLLIISNETMILHKHIVSSLTLAEYRQLTEKKDGYL